MAKDDYAIVIGISQYPDPELGSLQGPENDARLFRDWLIDEAGGAVPADHVQLIVSSQFQPTSDPRKAEPSDGKTIEPALEWYEHLARENQHEGRGIRVGRRLCIYLAGHGIELERDNDSYAVLLTANAMQWSAGHHVAGELWAKLYAGGRFDEAFLVMDCCRRRTARAALQSPPFAMNVPPEVVPRWLCALGAQWSLNAYEKRFGTAMGGVFTMTLLEALRGGASEPNGDITVRALKAYLNYRMTLLLSDDERDNPNVSKHPEVFYTLGDEVVIARAPPRKWPVEIRVDPAEAGKRFQILQKDFSVVHEEIVIAGKPVVASLPWGLYMAQIAGGPDLRFGVPGPGEEGAVHAALG